MRLLLLVVLAACVQDPAGVETSRVEAFFQPLRDPREADVLLVIDNSPAMATHRAAVGEFSNALANWFPGSALDTIHVAAITTDLGGPGCTPTGDAARPRLSALFTGPFIDHSRATGSNLRGTFAAALAELLDAGSAGCPHTQPLAAAQRLLADPPPGFVRAEAQLLIVFVTASDDASLASVDTLADSLRAAKPDPSMIRIGLVAGPANPHGLAARATSSSASGAAPQPAADCQADSAPAARLHQLLARFPNREASAPLCAPSRWSSVLPGYHPLYESLASPCFLSPLLDAVPETAEFDPVCEVEYRVRDRAPVQLAACTASGPPCWEIVVDEQSCPDAPSLARNVRLGDERRPYAAAIVGNCVVQ